MVAMEEPVKDLPVDAADPGFSLIQDPVLRLQRQLRVCRRDGFSAVRRALVLVAVSWLPIMIWAAMTGHLDPSAQDDSLMRHLGVHIRCLIGIPMLILSEPLAERVMRIVVGNFVVSGLIREEDHSAFARMVRSVERLRDSKVAWMLILALTALTTVLSRRAWLTEDADALVWGVSPSVLDFGGTWALYVVRPLFLFLLLSWLWRLILTWILFRRISRMDLQLVPSHPDKVGGIGFVRLHSIAFSLVVFAVSAVACASVGHQMLVHQGRLEQFQGLLILLVVLLVGLFMSPLTAFAARLRRTSIRAQFEYGTLAGRHVRALHRRWVDGKVLEDDILSAPEIGPAADVATLYGMGTSMQVMPAGKMQIASILVPALVPVLFVVSLEIPIRDILLKLLKTLG